MRPSFRLLTERLPPFTPTGITGVLTHPHPRPTLIALYNHTLSVLSRLPPHSVYRQSAENLTKARLEVLQSVKPVGWDGYVEHRQQKGLPAEADIRDVAVYMRSILGQLAAVSEHGGNKAYVHGELVHWDQIPWPETICRTQQQQQHEVSPNQSIDQANSTDKQAAFKSVARPPGEEANEMQQGLDEFPDIVIDLEPQLSAEQVSEIEEKIGEGLLEEVIEEGWGELQCAEAMLEDKCWEPLEVVPEEGQWTGFERTPSGP